MTNATFYAGYDLDAQYVREGGLLLIGSRDIHFAGVTMSGGATYYRVKNVSDGCVLQLSRLARLPRQYRGVAGRLDPTRLRDQFSFAQLDLQVHLASTTETPRSETPSPDRLTKAQYARLRKLADSALAHGWDTTKFKRYLQARFPEAVSRAASGMNGARHRAKKRAAL